MCMEAFSRAEYGHALHLRPTVNGILTSKMRSELHFVGWFMFQLMLKGVRVSRPFIKATMAFACGCIPLSADDPALGSWDSDFAAYKPAFHGAFKELMVDGEEAQLRALQSVTVADCPELAFAILKVKPGPAFVEAMEGLRKKHVYKWLFQDCAIAGEALNTGFTSCIDNLVESADLPLRQKKMILQTKDKFRGSPQFYEPVFGAELGIDVEDFLGSCVYVSMKKAVQVITFINQCLLYIYDVFVGLNFGMPRHADKSHVNGKMQTRFEACARGLPILDLQNLLFFITDSRYFHYAAMKVVGKPEWSQEKLPTSATCFNTLYMPLYDNEALMARKLSMATANCGGYGLL